MVGPLKVSRTVIRDFRDIAKGRIRMQSFFIKSLLFKFSLNKFVAKIEQDYCFKMTFCGKKKTRFQ